MTPDTNLPNGKLKNGFKISSPTTLKGRLILLGHCKLVLQNSIIFI